MSKVKIIIILITYFCFLINGFGFINDGDAKNTEIVKGELGTKLDRYLIRITPFGFSGALFVAKEGEIILNKGYGMAIRDVGIYNTAETVFSVGSITKQFTAAGIMKLEMQGKLNTNDPISRYLEDVPEDKKGITLHHLLTHTSGVINFTGRDYEPAKRDETIKKILTAPLLFSPGERFEYSNAGYSLLAAILEKVSGHSYEEFLNENLFKPSGMKNTGYRIPRWDRRVVAHWYVGEKDNGIPLDKPYPYWNLLGNGGILSTTGDMYRWHLALQGDEILSAAARKKLFTPFLNDYAYGWDVLKTEHGTLIQHDGGSMLGNSAEMRRYIDADLVTILFCNQSFEKSALFEPIREKIEKLIFGGDITIPPAVMECDIKFLQKFAGEYKLLSGGHLRATVENSSLKIYVHGQDAINLLLFPNQKEASINNALNTRSAIIFDAALKNDYRLFEEALLNKKALPRYRQFINMRLDRYKEGTGEIQNVVAIGTIPSLFDEGDAVVTVVKLKGEKESIFFRLHWREGRIIGMSPVRSWQIGVIPFMPVSETEFVGYHLGMAKNLQISFDIDSNGSVTGLIIQVEKGSLIAEKIR